MSGLTISALAFLGMILCYILINYMIRNKDMPAREEDKQIFIRSALLIATDMICWCPTLFFGKYYIRKGRSMTRPSLIFNKYSLYDFS